MWWQEHGSPNKKGRATTVAYLEGSVELYPEGKTPSWQPHFPKTVHNSAQHTQFFRANYGCACVCFVLHLRTSFFILPRSLFVLCLSFTSTITVNQKIDLVHGSGLQPPFGCLDHTSSILNVYTLVFPICSSYSFKTTQSYNLSLKNMGKKYEYNNFRRIKQKIMVLMQIQLGSLLSVLHCLLLLFLKNNIDTIYDAI